MKFQADPKTVTLEEAKEWLRQQVRGKGARCPCCDGNAKIYNRAFDAAMARATVHLFKAYRANGNEWMHAVKYLKSIKARDRDVGFLKQWGLLEEKPIPTTRPDGGKHAGFYRMTELGMKFAQRQEKIPARLRMYNGRTLSRSTEIVFIDEVKEFNYAELMNA
jgi:hypothetical protein